MILKRYTITDKVTGEWIATFYAHSMSGVNFYIGDIYTGSANLEKYNLIDTGGTMTINDSVCVPYENPLSNRNNM